MLWPNRSGGAHRGLGVQAHGALLGWHSQRMLTIAAGYPDALRRQEVTAEQVAQPSGRNLMKAFHYCRMHCTNWNANQAAALLCSVGHAKRLGFFEAPWVFPLANTESNQMVLLSARGDSGDCVGARLAGLALREAAALPMGMLEWLELCRCFSVAADCFADALRPDGFDAAPEFTVTGGMPFARGPSNNHVLQATCLIASLFRANPGTRGLVSSVSGVLCKQGVGVWPREPGEGGLGAVDVSAETACRSPRREVLSRFDGQATVVWRTVVLNPGQAQHALVLANTSSTAHVLARIESSVLVERLYHE